MAKNQKSYTPEFKQQIVDLHCKAGKGVTELRTNMAFQKAQSLHGLKILLQQLLQRKRLFL